MKSPCKLTYSYKFYILAKIINTELKLNVNNFECLLLSGTWLLLITNCDLMIHMFKA